MKNRLLWACLSGVVILSTTMAPVTPAAVADTLHVSPYIHVGQFDWEENTASGTVEESGLLYGLGAKGEIGLPVAALVLEGKGEFFLGKVDYEGYLQNEAGENLGDLNSDTEYRGITLEADLTRRIPLQGGFSLQPFGGLGVKTWTREIGSQYGYEEDWRTFYFMLGAGGTMALSPITDLFGSLALRYPLNNAVKYNDIPNSTSDPEVEPDSEISFALEAGASLKQWAWPIRVTVFYETLDFGRSNTEDGYYQPDSSATVLGLTAGTTF